MGHSESNTSQSDFLFICFFLFKYKNGLWGLFGCWGKIQKMHIFNFFNIYLNFGPPKFIVYNMVTLILLIMCVFCWNIFLLPYLYSLEISKKVWLEQFYQKVFFGKFEHFFFVNFIFMIDFYDEYGNSNG